VAAGNPGDVDFIGLTRTWRVEHANDAKDYEPAFSSNSRICVCVRKRPLNDKERNKSDHDSITCLNPNVWIHAAKKRVDGITKYLYVVHYTLS
jgi:kinesin family protein 2/24